MGGFVFHFLECGNLPFFCPGCHAFFPSRSIKPPTAVQRVVSVAKLAMAQAAKEEADRAAAAKAREEAMAAERAVREAEEEEARQVRLPSVVPCCSVLSCVVL